MEPRVMFSPTSVLAFATALLPITVIIFFSECVIAHLFLDFRGLVLRRHVSIFCFCEFFLWLVPPLVFGIEIPVLKKPLGYI